MIDSKWISRTQACVLMICSFVFYVHSDVPRPRGVSLAKASLYSPTKDFTCFDGTITIPFNFVNDDYCDCFDGSDEPGTSACLNAVFHCTNAGHRAQNIPSSRVNDGVCDCCDGTDEYTGETPCPNICDELGREARAEAQRQAELHKAGSHVRLELIEKGNKKRIEMGEHLSQLEKDREDAEKIKAEKESLKNELEAKENEVLKVYRDAEEEERQRKADNEKEQFLKEAKDHFERYDSNNDGTLSVDEIKVVNVFDKDKNGEVDEEELKYFMSENENLDLEIFNTVTFPLLKPLLMMEQGMFRAEQEPEPLEEEDPEAISGDIDELVKNEEADDLETEDEHPDDDLPHEETDDHDLQEEPRSYDAETQRLVDEATDARKQLLDAERTVREIESNIKVIKDNLEKDYGPQQEYATLDNECLEYEDKEYVYELCLFNKVTQKSKNGGSTVGLGNWGEWAGANNNIYSAMKYTNGVACWNGPNRMTTVHIFCGLETTLLSVTEPYRCEYKIELTTPAACDGNTVQQPHPSHDEL